MYTVKSISRSILLPLALMLALFCHSADAYAQRAKCNITGRVTDEGKVPVSYASVAIFDGTKPLTGAVTDDEGRFSLKAEQRSGEYRLVVEFMGYHKFEGVIRINTAQVNTGTIILKEKTQSLGEVVVSGKQAAQRSTIEHTTINASANMASSKGTAIDILRTSSSVNISNDQISIRGNANILVLLDGVPTTASDLSTIPAANIKSIEVITNPDASHDAGGTGGIINIISKKAQTEGFSGMVAANYGFNHFTSGNMALSWNRKKSSWRFNYNTKYEDDVVKSTLNRTVKHSGYEVFQQMQSARNTFNNNVALGADFRINPRNRLSVDAKLMLPRLNIEQELDNSFTQANVRNEEHRHNDVTWNRENIEAAITYTRIIKPEVSDITVRGSVSKIWGHRPSHYAADSRPVNRSVSGGSPFLPSLQADFNRKFKIGKLSAGAKLTYRRNDIYHEFYELTGGEWTYSEPLSNDLLHTELVPAAYALFSSRIGKKLSYKVGLRGEASTVTLDSRHEAVHERENGFFLAPSLSGTYLISEKQDFSLALSRRIGRPSYPQLNPYMSMVDATTYEQGNMYLQPEKSTKLDLSYNLKGKAANLFVNGYVNHTNDYISQITTLDGNTLVTTYVNAASDLKTGIELSLKTSPAKWMNLTLGTNTFHVTTKGTYKGAEIDNSGWTNNSNLMLDFLPWKNGDVQVQYFVTTPQYFPQLTTSLTHQMNVGVKQRILKGKMTLSLLLTDAFDTAKWEVKSRNNLFDLTNISHNKSRMLWLGASYNFNSFKQKNTQKAESDRSLIKFGL